MTDSTASPSPVRPRARSARDAVRWALVVAVVLVVCDGDAIGRAGETMRPGLERDVILAVGRPAGWIAGRLPFAAATDQVMGWLSPDEDLGNAKGSFSGAAAGTGPGRVPPQAFTPAQLGSRGAARPLRSVLVTGDSMSQPLDAELARRLARRRVRTVRDAHIGTGISKSFLLDWGKLSAQQARRFRPDAVVVFVGANEGFPIRTAGGTSTCCGAAWAAEYATRARAMMDAYRRDGATQVYWVLLPAPRDSDRARIVRVVNVAVRVAAGAFGAQVQLVDAGASFTPAGRYRDAIRVGGRTRIVRTADGIHLNQEGAGVLADQLLARFRATFTGVGA